MLVDQARHAENVDLHEEIEEKYPAKIVPPDAAGRSLIAFVRIIQNRDPTYAKNELAFAIVAREYEGTGCSTPEKPNQSMVEAHVAPMVREGVGEFFEKVNAKSKKPGVGGDCGELKDGGQELTPEWGPCAVEVFPPYN